MQSIHEFIALTTAIVSMLIGRHASMQDVLGFVARCATDPVLSFMTAAIALALGRLVYAGQLDKRNPSTLDKQRGMLEDAYGFRRFVSMSICADYTIFKSFLEVHYREAGRKSSKRLIQIGQFSLTLGSRRGVILRNGNWAIDAGAMIVNAVFVRTEEPNCLLCKDQLFVGRQVTFTGEHRPFCPSTNTYLVSLRCKIFFRDYDTLTPILFPATKYTTLETLTHATEGETTRPTSYRPEYVEYLDDRGIELEGLGHIDIYIVPKYDCIAEAARATSCAPPYLETPAGSEEEPPRTKGFEDEDITSSRIQDDSTGGGVLREHLDTPPVNKQLEAQLSDGVAWSEPSSRSHDAKAVPRKRVTVVEPTVERAPTSSQLESILKPPRTIPFPEDPYPTREGVAPFKQVSGEDIPIGARWTKISRILVIPEALKRARERFEEREDYVIVLRVLSRHEIDGLAEVTREIRIRKERGWARRLKKSDPWSGNRYRNNWSTLSRGKFVRQ